MSELKYVDFKPKWMENLTAEDERILGGFPGNCNVEPESPGRMTDSEQKELGDVFAQMVRMIYEDHRHLFQRNADERGVSLHQFAAAALAQAARERLDGK